MILISARDRDAWKSIEEGLGNAGRLKILRALVSVENQSQTKYGLEKVTGLSPTYVRKHLKILIETGWVKEYNYNPKVYMLNLDDAKVRYLLDFFKNVGYV